ncbi:hypothetical protein [Nocardia brasiliensis]|uniref:hypothetical protein n=1 Tax=Nocardia brasiliensis TaxID=37326 RepID=UPI0024560A51|nr:hypothetical protein [Nocardia brasiliensis]
MIDHVLPYRPRWWRIDPSSTVELSWDDPDDLETYAFTATVVVRSPRPVIRLRTYRDVVFAGEWTRVFGPWLTFDLAKNEHGHYGRTTIVDGVPRVDVYAAEPPSLGQWRACEPELEDAA